MASLQWISKNHCFESSVDSRLFGDARHGPGGLAVACQWPGGDASPVELVFLASLLSNRSRPASVSRAVCK